MGGMDGSITLVFIVYLRYLPHPHPLSLRERGAGVRGREDNLMDPKNWTLPIG
jgi:hypothetical protein